MLRASLSEAVNSPSSPVLKQASVRESANGDQGVSGIQIAAGLTEGSAGNGPV